MQGLTFLVLAALVVMVRPAFLGLELSAGQQAEVNAVKDASLKYLDDITEHFQEKASKIKTLPKAKIWKAVASSFGTALKAVSIAAPAIDVIFTFFMPSELSVIEERFDQLDAKIDKLDEKLDDVEQAIKVNTELNVFLADFISLKMALESGGKKLKQVRANVLKTNKEFDKVKLAHTFVKFYEENNLETKTETMYKMVVLPDSELHRNILDRFIEEKGCDVLMLSKLAAQIQRIMISAAVQKLTYYTFKCTASTSDVWQEIENNFSDVRRAFDDKIWMCNRDAQKNAKKDSTKIAKSKLSPKAIVNRVYETLKKRYPQYVWAVGMTEPDGHVGREWQGNTFFEIDVATDRKLLVVLEDPDVQLECSDVENARTVLVFERKGSDMALLRAAPNFLTIGKCGDDGFKIQYRRSCNNYGTNCYNVGEYYAIASNVTSDKNECLTQNICNNHGQCNAIPYTTDVQCICSGNWSGEYCERNDTVDDTVLRELESLHKNLNISTCVPDFLDLYYAVLNNAKLIKGVAKRIEAILTKHYEGISNHIEGISKQMKDLREDNHLSRAQTHILIKHAATIQHVEFVARAYNQKQRGEIDFGEFGGRLFNLMYITTPNKLMFSLESMITAKGTVETPGEDIFSVYKRAYVAKYPNSVCSAAYNKNMTNMMDSLSYLDEILGKALVDFKRWHVETSATNATRRVIYLNDAETIKERFVPRQTRYYEYWSEHSCGNLTIEGMHVDCQEMLTYKGLSFTPSCNHQRVSQRVTCQETISGDLEWSSQPTCKYVWAPFGPFESCSKTCGGGRRRAYRTCLGTNDVNNCFRDAGGRNYKEESCNTNGCPYWSSFGSFGACSKTCGGGERIARRRCVGASSYVCRRDRGGYDSKTESCNTHSCCPYQSDKYQCSNGRCIPRRWLCTGRDGCGNNDDESDRNCPNALKSGSKMALKNVERHNHWLSCYDDKCDLRNCPGDRFNSYGWNHRCDGEKFFVEAVDLPTGSIIRHKAMVRFRRYASYNYLRCGSITKHLIWARWRAPMCTKAGNWGQECLKFRIYRESGDGYVRRGDYVYIKSVQFGYWLGGSYFDGVNLRHCYDLAGCVEEKWKLYVQ